MKKLSTFKTGGGKALLVLLLLGVSGLTRGYAYDFSATHAGQTLYFTITNASNKLVSVVCPGTESFAGCYEGFERPTGALEIPASIVNPNDSETYTVTQIGKYAFYNCTGLTTLTLPEGLLSIGDDAFDNCRNLYKDEASTIVARTLTIPSTVTSIGAGAFYYVYYIYKVEIPSSVTTIGQNAFRNCGNLRVFTIPSSVTSLGMHAFTNTYRANQEPDGVLYLDNCLVGWKGSVPTGQLTIPEGTRLICDNAFYSGFSGNEGMALTGDLVIPNSVTVIGYQSFRGCTGLTSLTLGRSVWLIWNGAFYGCTGLDGILAIPSTTVYLFGNAFGNCTGIDCIVSEKYGTINVGGGNPFYNIPTSVPIYIPAGSSSYYNGTPWSNYTRIDQKRISAGNWSDGTWTGDGNPPTDSDVVCIYGTCTLDVDASPRYVYIGSTAASCKITINSGITLSPTYGIRSTQYYNQIIVENGGKLVNPHPYTNATVKKSITGYDGGAGNWNMIASPVTANLVSAEVTGLVTGEYDLYYLNESEEKWINYKDNGSSSDPGFAIQSKKGYLYANNANTTIQFVGTLQQDGNVTLSKNNRGWNLIGNPFTCNAFYNSTYYAMNAAGDAFEAKTSGDAIPPCTGIIVEAASDGQVVTFSKTAPLSGYNPGHLNIALAETTREAVMQDNAIVSFKEGEDLDKFVFNSRNALIYFQQNGKSYAVLGNSNRGEMALNFKAAHNGNYTLSFSSEIVEFNSLRLIDNFTGTSIDLKANPSYSFSATAQDNPNRFRLVFDVTDVNEYSENASFAYFNGSEWVVNASDNASVQVVDVTGRIVLSTDATRHISTSSMAPGMYVIRLTEGDNVKTQKIVVK